MSNHGEFSNSDKKSGPGNRPFIHEHDSKYSTPVDESRMLDAFSSAVSSAYDVVAPAVINVRQPDAVTGINGSGLIVSDDGFIVTSARLVGDQTSLKVVTGEGDWLYASVVGSDTTTDIAVLKLNASGLSAAVVEPSGPVRPGQLAIAIGNPQGGSPYGTGATVSTGVISAVGSSMRSPDWRLLEGVLQHSAPLYPGYPGGPLVDSQGMVIGINTATNLKTHGPAFAIPSLIVQNVFDSLVQHGRVQRRLLGITGAIIPLQRETIIRHDLLSDRAVQVVDVQKESAASASGLQKADVVLEISGRIITGVDDIHRLLDSLPASQPLPLTILRSERILEIELVASA